MSIRIRESIPDYLKELKGWLAQTQDVPLEAMGDFFTARVGEYEAHMARWAPAYRRMAEYLPGDCRSLLDIGCGTGLELDEIYGRFPALCVTGVDLCEAMLEQLAQKHADKRPSLICADYFVADLGRACFDAAVSFETLHHFSAAQKTSLFAKIRRALKPGGVYIQADYIACCPEEETMLFAECARRRARDGVEAGRFVHFDTPLTLEHEIDAMREAGFVRVQALEAIEGATLIAAWA